jgi:hypothetical protein
MRKTFVALDDALIERVFQPVFNFVSRRLGVTRAVAACFCVDIASLAWIISRAQGASDAVAAWDAITVFLDGALLLLGVIALISLRTLFRRAAAKKQANPLRLAMQPHRAVVLLMLVARLAQLQPISLTDTADLVMLTCAAAALYLGACAEPPPLRYRTRIDAMIPQITTDAA